MKSVADRTASLDLGDLYVRFLLKLCGLDWLGWPQAQQLSGLARLLAVVIALSVTISTRAGWAVLPVIASVALALEVKRVQARTEDPARTGGIVVEAKRPIFGRPPAPSLPLVRRAARA